MRRVRALLMAVVLGGGVASSCNIAGFSQPTPAGDWRVVTKPFPLVGHPVKIIFRFREGEARPSQDSFAFTVTCTSCAEPKPVVAGTASKETGNGSEALYSETLTFPTAGTWWTSPYVGPIEVR